MKNPIRNFYHCLRTWLALRRYPGLFCWSDASLQLNRVIMPSRFAYRAAGLALERITQIEALGQEVFKISLPDHALCFYWKGQPNNNLYFLIEQEFNPQNPHYYTTPPVALGADSLVLDVGACEGLFALRVLRQGLAARVICFEPSRQMAQLIGFGGETNQLAQRLKVETLAVGKVSERVGFEAGLSADAGRVQPAAEADPDSLIDAVCLDDYCGQHHLGLSPRDLIKIDAEGADFDVLQGAEQLIRAGSPQIAVTTYHEDHHCEQIVDWLKQIQPAYRLRLKGFASWTKKPRPVLLQAAL